MKKLFEYRIGTRYHKYTEEEIINNKLSDEGWHEYLIIEVFYEIDYNNPKTEGIINGVIPNAEVPIIASYYTESNVLKGWNNLKDLSNNYAEIQAAFEKPIIDIDNFPIEL